MCCSKGKTKSLIEGFRRDVEDSSISELNLDGGKYTWERGRGSKDWVR